MTNLFERTLIKTFSCAAVVAANAICVSSLSQASSVIVPYGGSFDEATVPTQDGLPTGDYDTIGGLLDVGQFNLVAGDNFFMGGVWTPGDSSDAFLISIAANQMLTSASIVFGTNVTPNTPFFGFPSPQWTLEESGPTPTVFDLPVGINGMTGPQTVFAPAFSRGEGIYSVLIGNGTFGINFGNFNTPVLYKMTFNVTQKVSDVPLPAALPLFAAGLGALGYVARRKRRARQ